eukprot:6795531-Alexandrium_andersonii.AAC.1
MAAACVCECLERASEAGGSERGRSERQFQGKPLVVARCFGPGWGSPGPAVAQGSVEKAFKVPVEAGKSNRLHSIEPHCNLRSGQKAGGASKCAC